MQDIPQRRRIALAGFFNRLHEHVEADRMFECLVNHEIAVALAEALRQVGCKVVTRGGDRKDSFRILAKPFVKVGNYIASGAADPRYSDPLLPHDADDLQTVVEVRNGEDRLRIRSAKLID